MFQVRDNAIGNIKYSGRSRAVVIDNLDPLKKGRIRVNHPLLGETSWIPYLTPPGMFSVPDVDDVVYLECDAGFHTHPVAWGNLNRDDEGDLKFPEEFQRINPTNRGIYTPDGHLLEFDDGTTLTKQGKGVKLTTSGGNKISILEDLTAAGGLITVETSAGAKATLDGTMDSIKLETAIGSSIEMTPTGIKAKEVAGATLHLSTGQVALGASTGEVVDLLVKITEQVIQLTTNLIDPSLQATGNLGFVVIPNPALSTPIMIQLNLLKAQLETIKGSI